MTDGEWLQEFGRGSQAAFAGLVRRHVDLVYAAALRRTRDPATAEDVTQAVFLLLAKKADALRNRPTVAGWLVLATRHVAKTTLRSAARRTRHEHAAAKPEAVADPAADAADLAPLLDDALARLRTADRDAVALRYLEGRSFAEVAVTLGVSEEAARKRVDRAVVRLRAGLSRRGAALTAAALVAGMELSSQAVAPPTLAAGVRAGPPAGPGIFKGALKMMTIKNAAIASAVLLAATTGATGGVLFWAVRAADAPATSVARAAPPATAPLVGEYYLGGNVNAPGAYSINGRTITLKQALTAARGPTEGAGRVRFVRRQADGTEATRDIPLADALAGLDDPALRPDDQIIVLPATTNDVKSLALELRVKDVEANIDFFQKLGFAVRFRDKPDAAGRLPRASVFSGVVAVRLGRTTDAIRPDGMTAHFWVDGGPAALAARRDAIVANGVKASGFNDDTGLRGFTVDTPDGYRFGFYSLKQ